MEKNQNNEMTIGIPRGMSFYHNYPFYYGFFTDLGIKIVLSDVTTKQTMTSGSALVVTETCLPIKVYIGHVLNLIDKGIDKIFVPSIQSIAPKIYNCSKIRGLPDLVRNVVKKEFTMIEATLDKSEKNQGLYEFLAEMVAPFGITDMEKIKKASKAGWRTYNNFHIMSKSGMSYKKAMNYALQGKVFIENQTKEFPISIALISHGYNIFDGSLIKLINSSSVIPSAIMSFPCSCAHSSINLSALCLVLHSLQSINGSEKPPTCPDATQVSGFIKIAASNPTISFCS